MWNGIGLLSGVMLAAVLSVGACTGRDTPATPKDPCAAGTVRADVVVLDQPIPLNRLGSYVPGGMVFALATDVVPQTGDKPGPGNAQLRKDKRPRPLVLRVNAGQCLDITLHNYLTPVPASEQPKTRKVGLHADGMEWRTGPADDGTYVGRNPTPLLEPGDAVAEYHLFAPEEGTFLLYTTGDNSTVAPGFFPMGGQMSEGLFGAVNVQPPGAEWYRSQVSHADLALAQVPGRTTPDGHPLLNYDARYPNDPAKFGALAGRPILRMDDDGLLVHSDLTAIITGPGRGDFRGEGPSFAPVTPSPDRREPYREITTIYHELKGTVTQAFDEVYNPGSGAAAEDQLLAAALGTAYDGFGINYGVGGIANEILANRFGVGPAGKCADCRFEEFFLSSWAQGDPAMILDKPVWASGGGAPAYASHPDAVVLYPDDPSNVYHSYLSDHVKFRVLHGGASLHHIHHQHAHQWLHSPDKDRGHYLDSQSIGPGSGYTLEMVYGGAGNRNLTVGDSIFHCHFYPHFAQGMWSLWRVHDVFEAGTPLDEAGRATGRAQPDGEILAGTPIPALVPIPTKAMAPLPADVRIDPATGQIDRSIWPDGRPPSNPGYPFFVPGVAGARPPRPPLDMAHDGGLPRHLILPDGNKTTERHTWQDFSKEASVLNARALAEDGEPAEQVAMAFHAQREWASFNQLGEPLPFLTNGQPPKPGAPYADPCTPNAAGQVVERYYKAANLQADVLFTKTGWHLPQTRMVALWQDVVPTLLHTRAPEPFFFRAHSGDCIVYMHTNLVPSTYALDAFQVRTPTDILGQHIHLVKFDVTSSDGAANGWNYEDGALSPAEVQARIAAIDAYQAPDGQAGLLLPDGTRQVLTAEPHPYFGDPKSYPDQEAYERYSKEWLGAQVELQRWWADPLLDEEGDDRTLRTVFTHDHFGPSTHQEAGLYAGLLVEPAGSVWRDPVTGVELSPLQKTPDGPPIAGRIDGGPTSWQANIDATNPEESFRELVLIAQDMLYAYEPGLGYPANPGATGPGARHFATGSNADNVAAALDGPRWPAADPRCVIAGEAWLPCPYLIADFQPATSFWDAGLGRVSVNYRAEPIPPRLAAGGGAPAPDAAEAFRSVPRPYAAAGDYPTLATQTPTVPSPGGVEEGKLPPLTAGMGEHDPYTPLLRAYAGERVEIAVLAGAHLDLKGLTVHDVRWLAERHDPDSGFRNNQTYGLSEHFELDFRVPVASADPGSPESADYLYLNGAAQSDVYNGAWGLLRAYSTPQPDLVPLNSGVPAVTPAPTCPPDAPVRAVRVAAVDVQSVFGPLVYSQVASGGTTSTLTGVASLMYVLVEESYQGETRPGDLDAAGRLTSAPRPLVLRANAGDCVQVTLENRINPAVFSTISPSALPQGTDGKPLTPSASVGLYPQLLELDISQSDGFNVGNNPVQTVPPGGPPARYTWYAGRKHQPPGAPPSWQPVEYGTLNLLPAEPLIQQALGLFGVMVVEPKGATWQPDAGDRTQAWVKGPRGWLREAVLALQNGLILEQSDPALANCASPSAVNYQSAPLPMRLGACPDWSKTDMSATLSDTLVAGADPTSPIVLAPPGVELRIRLVNPGGTNQNQVFTLSGHVWQEEPYLQGSTEIGSNPLSNVFGALAGQGPGTHTDVVLRSAGGTFAVPGDYLYRTFDAQDLTTGQWGIVRVQDGLTAPPP